MPYKIEEQNGVYIVINPTSGKISGKHKTKEGAIAQLRALYANMPAGEQKSPPAGHPFYGNQYIQFAGSVNPATVRQGWASWAGEVSQEFHDKNTATHAYRASLTQDENQAMSIWGGSSVDFAKLDRGEDVGTGVRAEFAKKYYPSFLSAVDKAPIYNGTIYRGMGDVPSDAINAWTQGGEIKMNNHASSTYDPKIAQGFMGGTGNQVLFTIASNKTGRNIMGATNVSQGGKHIFEAEVVIMPGAKYAIKGWSYFKPGDDKPLDMDWYFEGTGFSSKNLPPDIASNKWGLNGGTWKFNLEEIG